MFLLDVTKIRFCKNQVKEIRNKFERYSVKWMTKISRSRGAGLIYFSKERHLWLIVNFVNNKTLQLRSLGTKPLPVFLHLIKEFRR